MESGGRIVAKKDMKDKSSNLTDGTSSPHRYDTGARVPGSEEHEQHAAAEWTDIGALHEWTGNPRRNDDNVGAVAASIKRFGFAAPIVARANGEIIAGHTRFRAAHMLGMQRVPVRYLDLSEREAHLLALADNKLTENSEWDDLTLARVLSEYGLEEAEIAGFDSKEIDQIASSLISDLDPSEVDMPDDAPTIVQRGDVWKLGKHRLYCMDSRQTPWPADTIDIVWTDPPYGVGYEGVFHGKDKAREQIENDGLDESALRDLLLSSLGNVCASCKDGAAWYVASPAGTLFGVFASVLNELGVWRHTIAWVKNHFVMGRADYHYKHESIFYGWKGGSSRAWYGGRDKTSVLEFDKPSSSKEHPTMKPVGLVAACIKNHIAGGETVADPFGGSGTTLLAADQLGVTCFTSEIDPKYCDVIIARWKSLHPGAEAVKE